MERVLVIDDDVGLCELVGEYLQPEGYTVEAIHNGEKVTEVPATLESRLIGRSKMRVLPVILGHLRLLAELSRLPPHPAPEPSRQDRKAMVIRA